jgi:hypothetical protein
MRPTFKDVITWPEFTTAWILLIVVIAAFVVDYLFLAPFLAMIEGGLLLIIFVLVVVSIYRTSAADRA